jgi:hypothetical protein
MDKVTGAALRVTEIERGGLPSSDDVLLTLRELATYLRRHEMVVWREAKAGRLPGIKIANRWMFRTGAIRAWLRAQEEAAVAQAAAQ